MTQWTQEEKKELPNLYGCELLFERVSLDQIKDKSLPNDAYIVVYEVDGNSYMDLCRGARVKIFDLYYDKFGSKSIKKIDFGYGRTNPKLWGYKAPEAKKKRK